MLCIHKGMKVTEEPFLNIYMNRKRYQDGDGWWYATTLLHLVNSQHFGHY